MPYFDHSEYIIGMKKGWFEEVGITILPKPHGKIVPFKNQVSVLASGAVDIISGAVMNFIPTYKTTPPVKGIIWMDIFQGNAILAQPNAGYKSIDEYIAGGCKPEEALRRAILQGKGKKFGGKKFGVLEGPGVLSVFEEFMKKGGVSRHDVDLVSLPDPKLAAMMISGRIDFWIGSAPTRVTLESKGFKPIVGALDIAKYAEPSPESKELRAIFHDGAVSTDSWINANHDTMLRFVGVCARILAFMNEHQSEAIEIQLPFVNSAGGTNITFDEAVVIYESLDPFIPFENQWNWYLNPNDPFYVGNVEGAAINYWVEGNVILA
jgi:ABC-type nitrate/sulfonate/bicarbonate transport system substrate-binding protein